MYSRPADITSGGLTQARVLKHVGIESATCLIYAL